METDIDTAADRVIGITNAVGAAAANVQNSKQAAQSARQILRGAARNPDYLAAAGAVMMMLSAGLKLRERETRQTDASVSDPAPAGSPPS